MLCVGESTGELDRMLKEDGPPKSLHHLNEKLIKYIKMAKSLEENQGDDTIPTKSTIVDVKIDREKLLSIGIKYDGELTDYPVHYGEINGQIAALKAKICQLKAEIKITIKSDSGKDGAISDIDLTIEKQRAELLILEANLTLARKQKEIFDARLKSVRIETDKTTKSLNSVVSDYIGEKKKNSVLSVDPVVLEKGLRFKITTLKCEIEAEPCGDFWDGIDCTIEKEHKIKMDHQLELLRKLYEKHTVGCKTSLEKVYKDQIDDLEKKIDQLPKPVEHDNEFQELQVKLEMEQLKVTDLKTNQMDMVTKQTSLESDVCKDEIWYNKKMSAKQQEFEMLKKENKEITMKYMKLMEEFPSQEVQKYSEILWPEISRISRRCGTESYVNIGKTLNFSSFTETGGGGWCGTVLAKPTSSSSSSSSSSGSSSSDLDSKFTETVTKKTGTKAVKSEASRKESTTVLVKETTQTSTIEGSLYVKKGSSQAFDSSRKC